MTALLWFRRDLRLRDHPALLAAASAGPVVPLFVLDPSLWNGGGVVRRAWLARTLRGLNADLGGRLVLRVGRPEVVVPAVAAELGADTVHVTRETTPVGSVRDARVAAALAAGGRALVETGTPYAVGPGLIRKPTGEPYRVFTPFSRAWRAHGWPRPAGDPAGLSWRTVPSSEDAWAQVEAAAVDERAPEFPAAGEEAALAAWREFRDEGGLAAYASARNRPDLAGTSRLSPHLKLGTIHPRTLLADLPPGRGTDRFVTEIAWREFYADVLHHHPRSARHDLTGALAALRYDDPSDPEVAARVDAWREGRTGYPIVDAGMRQLLATGWMHNRVRMITASFLTKDLHVRWQVGAAHFLDRLIDGDVASNAHGWQWVAGTGTDAAPYFRVFNPVLQGGRFDPSGDYVRRWVPELAHLAGATAHEPWTVLDGYAAGYPERIVDHAEERAESLRRLAEARTSP